MMKYILKKMWGWILISILYILAIHIIFQLKAPCAWFVPDWEAQDILLYGGSIIGASATIYAVITTIQFEKSQEKARMISASKPWIFSDTLLLNSFEEVEKYHDFHALYISQRAEKSWDSSFEIPYNIRKKTHKFNQDSCYVMYKFSNAGGNTATSLQITINDFPVIPSFALPLSVEKILIIELQSIPDQENTIYNIKFEYGDIVSDTKYSQNEQLNIKKVDYGITLSQSMDMLLSNPNESEV